MRILYVCTDADVGGAERFLLTLARHKRAGDHVGLVVLMERGSLSDLLEDAFDSVTYLNHKRSSRNLLGMVRGLERECATFAPEVVSSHLFHADLVLALSRIDAAKTTTIHTQGFGPTDHPLTKAIARAVGALSWRFDAVVPAGDSTALASFASQLGYRNMVSPIANAADLPDQPEFRASHRRFLSLGRNHPVKGHAVLFAAFVDFARTHSDWGLDCLGAGITEQDPVMQRHLAEAGADDLVREGRISLHGPTSSPEMWIARSAALVISSTYGEAFPIVGVEAAGAGVPVITTNVGNSADFADDPRFVVRPGDSGALCAALSAYADLDDDARLDLSRLARQRAEHLYSPKRAADDYREVFETVISARRLRSSR